MAVKKQSLSEGQSHLQEHVFWSGTNPQAPAMKNSGIPAKFTSNSEAWHERTKHPRAVLTAASLTHL